MARLSVSDTERVLRFAAEAESLGGDQLFSPDSLVELGKLIEADWVSYSELDRVRKRDILYVCRPGEESDEGELDLYWEIEDQHPTCSIEHLYPLATLKLSDVVALSALRRTEIYDRWFRPCGIDYELSILLPSPAWHTKVLMFDRATGSRDFSERDRQLLNCLAPHLSRLWAAAKTRRMLRAALAELERVDEQDHRGVILLGADGTVEFTSPPAARLLREFFVPEAGGRLPSPLVAWLDARGGEPFVRRRGDRVLTASRDESSLVLEERTEDARLTARERDVLSWVARGKTNAEIAELLWLAPSTVRKHLENVYAKLGVSTRTAAVARFFGLSEAS